MGIMRLLRHVVPRNDSGVLAISIVNNNVRMRRSADIPLSLNFGFVSDFDIRASDLSLSKLLKITLLE